MKSTDIGVFVVIFYNVRSGNRQGTHLKNYTVQHYRLKKRNDIQVQLYQLGTDEFTRGIQFVKDMYHSTTAEIHIWSAGGDGTLTSIIESSLNSNLKVSDPRLVFSVMPFGTGNDLSQSLGWGRSIKRKFTKDVDKFNGFIFERTPSTRSSLDIWRVHIQTNPGGSITKIQKDRTIEPKSGMSKIFCNYMTIGVQGKVGAAFEKNRQKNRSRNILMYFMQSISKGLFSPMPRVKGYLKSFKTNTGTELTLNKSRAVELIFQNINGIWGRNIRLWDSCRKTSSVADPVTDETRSDAWTLSTPNDGKFEVFMIRSRLDYILKQARYFTKLQTLARIGQFSGPFQVNLKENTKEYVMIDGEFYVVQNGKSIIFEHETCINVNVNQHN